MAFAVVMVPYLLSDSLKLKALIIVILQLLLILLRRYVTDFTEVMNEMRLIIKAALLGNCSHLIKEMNIIE